jgi:hypothetical protein
MDLADDRSPHPAAVVQFAQKHQVVEPLGLLETDAGPVAEGSVPVGLGVSYVRRSSEFCR